MINYWWVTRPKRKLNSIPEVLATFADISLNQEWEGQKSSHLAYEEALEKAGLKRQGERRDQGGSGARTYKAWLVSLGLIFIQNNTKRIKLTLAGEAIMNGESPVAVLTEQILKYQFPSAFSVGRGVDVSRRFRIHPFRFLIRLLLDRRIGFLTEEEIAKIVVTEAETDSDRCYEYIVERICQFRNFGESCLAADFFIKYSPSKGEVNPEHPYSHLMDLANTLVNWLEYTQLVRRDDGKVQILQDRISDALAILERNIPLIDRPEDHEYYQRKYGVDPKHRKDTRNLSSGVNITPRIIANQKIRQAFITASLQRPITSINGELVDFVVESTGIGAGIVEELLMESYPNGAIGGFMTRYFDLAFKGREDAVEFEKATVEIFRNVFGFDSRHVGPVGLSPDVLILSDNAGYQAIIDNKAYQHYSISNDHHNRMVHNYIRNMSRYSDSDKPLGFFTYIAGGFGNGIDRQIQQICAESGVNGSAISVANVIKLVEKHQASPYSHQNLKDMFSINRKVLVTDL